MDKGQLNKKAVHKSPFASALLFARAIEKDAADKAAVAEKENGRAGVRDDINNSTDYLSNPGQHQESSCDNYTAPS